MNRPKQIGTRTETAIKRAAHLHGFPLADRLALSGALDRGDVLLCPGVIVEAKGGKAAERASHNQIRDWLIEAETERRNAGAGIGFLVTKRRGVGDERAHLWAAHFTLANWAVLTECHGWAQDLGQLAAEPLTIQLAAAFQLLRLAGWGDPL